MVKSFLQSHPVHKKIAPIFDRLFLVMPPLFFPIWVMVVIGMASAKINFNLDHLWITNISMEVLFVFIG